MKHSVIKFIDIMGTGLHCVPKCFFFIVIQCLISLLDQVDLLLSSLCQSSDWSVGHLVIIGCKFNPSLEKV